MCSIIREKVFLLWYRHKNSIDVFSCLNDHFTRPKLVHKLVRIGHHTFFTRAVKAH